MLKQKLKLSLSALLISAIAAIIWSEFYMSQRNVLAFKKDWHLAQEGFINPGLHVIPNLLYRKLLIGYRLSSDNLMGMVRLLSNDEVEPQETKLWFRIGSDSYLDIIFNAQDSTFTGIRLSSSDLFPSGFYQSDVSGKFISFQPIGLTLESGFKSVEIKNGKLSIDKKEITLPADFIKRGKAGIHVSTLETEVYAFEVKTKNKRSVLHFFPEGERWTLYGKHFFFIVILVMLSGLLPRARKEIFASALLGAGFLGLLFSFVVRPQNESIEYAQEMLQKMDSWWRPGDQPALSDRIEKVRRDKYFPGIFHCTTSGCRMLAENELPPKKEGKRILVFGGSQVKPSLVRKIENSFYFRFDRYLRDQIPGVETMNIHATGQFKDRLKFEPLMEKMEIDEIIIETLAFSHELDLIQSFMARWNKKGVRIILLRTPQNIENFGERLAPVFIPKIREGLNSEISPLWDPDLAHVLRNVPLIRKMKEEVSFEFLDPNDVFLSEKVLSSGQLYWDGYHLTDWGQEIMAKWLANAYVAQRLK